MSKIYMDVYESGDKIGRELVDVMDKKDIERIMRKYFEFDSYNEIEVEGSGDEVWIGLNEEEYMWSEGYVDC